MEEDWSHLTERILNFTLEIIYLLTGEGFPPLKSGGHVTIAVPPRHSPICKRNNRQKILKVTNKIIELLMGWEEGEHLERQKDQEKNIMMEDQESFKGEMEGVLERGPYVEGMMENQPSLTSPDGSSNINPTERCTGYPYSQDCTQEDHSIPRHYQRIMKPEPKEKKETFLRQSTEEGEMIKTMKVEEETHVKCEQQSMKDVEMMRTIKEEESSLDIGSDGRYIRNPSEKQRIPPAGNAAEDKIFSRCSPVIGNTHLRGYKTGGITHPPDLEESSSPRSVGTEHRNIAVSIGLTENAASIPFVDEDRSLQESVFSCTECGKCYQRKAEFIVHLRLHTGERPFSCSVCGKGFLRKAHLLVHHKIHSGERPYSCTECGKSFSQRGHLFTHQKIHRGERPFSCSECGKCFTEKGNLIKHQRRHTGERPFSCSQCGKCFSQKGALLKHQQTHSSPLTYPCSVCGKCFKIKGNLVLHQKKYGC